MDNKVSIIIPVYNVEKYLERCLDSLVNQTDKNIEIIAINDGSKDSSLEIIEKYAIKDNRIKIINKENGGLASARNAGLTAVMGEYVMFVDSDDWLELDTIEVLKRVAIDTKSDIVKAFYMKDNGITSQTEDMGIGVDILEAEKKDFKTKIYPILINTPVLNSAWIELIKTKLILDNDFKFDETIKYGEDHVFNYRLYTLAQKVVLINKPYYHYFYNPNSITTSKGLDKTSLRCMDAIKNYSLLYEYIKEWDMDNEVIRKQIAKRMMREITNRTKEAFVLIKYGISKNDIELFVKEMWNNEEINKSIKINNKEKYGMSGLESKIYEKTLAKGNIDMYIKEGLSIYKIKHIFKKLLGKV